MKKIIVIVAGLGLLLVVVFFVLRSRPATIIFVGDMNFDRYIRQVSDKNGDDFVFSCVADFLQEADLVVGNLEGPITDRASVSVNSVVGSPQNFIFTFPPGVAKRLKQNNIRLVNLGNNHVDDFGETGIASTQNFLQEAGVDYFGGFRGAEPIFRTKLGGTKISFISYNQFGGDSPQKVATKIKEEKKNGQTVIVYTHWSEEYISANSAIKNTAKLFADAGARLIIGSHPHVILPSAKIHSTSSGQVGDATVYYSLGNFIFDQYWNSDVSTGLALAVTIKDGEMELVEHRVIMNKDGRTCLADN